MRNYLQLAGIALAGLLALGSFGASKLSAQDPILTPILVNTAVPIVVNAVTAKPTGLLKYPGYVMNANSLTITVRSKKVETMVQSFSLSPQASAKMQQLIDAGGYQYGDKITVYYDPQSQKAVKFKGKPSKPL
jgi:hypothetical protein